MTIWKISRYHMILLVAIIDWLSKKRLVVLHPTKIKAILLIYPLPVILYFNHWIAAITGTGFYIFISGILIHWFNTRSGMTSYTPQVNERHLTNKVNALKITTMLITSIPFVWIFSTIDPIKIIYISGKP